MPEVRQQKKEQVTFTEKKFPHLPTRESHLKEPPYPKSKKMEKADPKAGYVDIEEKDPVWLKDKGDHFFKRNDFTAAISAYSKALAADKTFLAGFLNRAACWIKMRQFENAILDCRDIEGILNGIKAEEREADTFYAKIEARMLVKKGAAQSWVSKFDEAVESFKQALQFKGIFSESELSYIECDIKKIERRRDSVAKKVEGDNLFAEA